MTDRNDWEWTNPPEYEEESEPDYDKMNDDIWIHERQKEKEEQQNNCYSLQEILNEMSRM